MDLAWVGGAAAGAGAILTAVGSIVSARASRGKARRDEVDRLQAALDSAEGYIYTARRVMRQHGVEPPPWTAHEPPPWTIERGGPP